MADIIRIKMHCFGGIADAHQKTIAQVVLRWNVQRGVTVIPKSTRRGAH
ncbi:hypothetical protein IE979_26950 [Klebsiella pneumoniae]|uniref:Uncharacterized protein n=1 Tax=Klebsiella pneumoniae TaxID=573 RepID=A0A927HGP6_KLEPN|nr:hypothetical protein [Klebsiella pneumoniae]MBD3701332.1 hypothetical protein [Klebsiella pneumoniae]MBD3705941.1 hypothetical protein [Klebsiella pneumoniae]MBD3716503.1 hypothetical protein [Klebsiella pneumoniae]MBD3720016.1 hypothetical protein [Klebsiella pneumoniae]